MSKKNLDNLRKGEEFVKYAKSCDCTIRNGKGSHVVISNDKGSIVVPVHNQDLGVGLRCKIVKAFVALGLAALVLFYVSSLLG